MSVKMSFWIAASDVSFPSREKKERNWIIEGEVVAMKTNGELKCHRDHLSK